MSATYTFSVDAFRAFRAAPVRIGDEIRASVHASAVVIYGDGSDRWCGTGTMRAVLVEAGRVTFEWCPDPCG